MTSVGSVLFFYVFFKQKTANEMRISDWCSDVCSSDLATGSLIVEIYTSIAARAAKRPKGRTKIRDALTLDAALAEMDTAPHRPLPAYDDHATDALLTVAWMRKHAPDPRYWSPALLTDEIACTEEIGRANVRTPVTNAHLVCRLLLE